jgi:hypothetical protein
MAKKNVTEVAAMPQCKVYGVECKGKRLQRCLEDARTASYSLSAPHNATSVIGDPAEVKGERREAKGKVIVVIILCQNLATAKQALDIIQRDLGSQLLQVEQCDTIVGAYLTILRSFNPSECLSFYHYHLDRSLQGRAAIYLTTQSSEGGTR